MTSTTTRAGIAHIDITPDWPVMQAGFGQRTTPNSSIRDHVFAKALYLNTDDAHLLLITADLICIPAPLRAAVVGRILADPRVQSQNLTAEQICLCASHTHSGPVPWSAGDGEEGTRRYSEFLVAALTRVGCDALTNVWAAYVKTAVGQVDFLFNRRTRGQPNRVDPRVPVLSVYEATTDRLTALLFGVGCHPVTLGWDSLVISADFPGEAQRLLEARFPDATALFFNTTEGNVIPDTSPDRDALDPRGYCGTGDQELTACGRRLAQAVEAALEHAQVQSPFVLSITSLTEAAHQNRSGLSPQDSRTRFEVARQTLRDRLGEDFEAHIPAARLWAAMSQVVMKEDLSETAMRTLMIAGCDFLGLAPRLRSTSPPRPVQVMLQVLVLGDLKLLALPGEVMVETGEAWSAATGSSRAFVIGLANAHFRYLPTAALFAEPEADVRYETVTAGLATGAIDGLILKAAALLATEGLN